jgi:RNA polymerase sigma-70 factor (ECF subfamily)
MNETSRTPSADAELITQAQKGDVDAFGQLYERYIDRIFRYIRARVGQDRIAEDISEMVFLRSFESLDAYKERGHPFSAYLYQVARNLLVDHYREVDNTLPLQGIESKEASTLDTEQSAIQQEKMAALVDALANLPDEYQEVIRLRVLMQMPTSETSEWMNRSEGAVRVLLHRAMKALKKKAEEIYES